MDETNETVRINSAAENIDVTLRTFSPRLKAVKWDFMGLHVFEKEPVTVQITGRKHIIRIRCELTFQAFAYEKTATAKDLDCLCALISNGCEKSDWSYDKDGRFCQFFVHSIETPK